MTDERGAGVTRSTPLDALPAFLTPGGRLAVQVATDRELEPTRTQWAAAGTE